jgi:hypothetical protein
LLVAAAALVPLAMLAVAAVVAVDTKHQPSY